MLDWLSWTFGLLWATPEAVMLFLGVPIVVSLVLAIATPQQRLGASLAAVVIALVVSLIVYLAIYLTFFTKGPTGFAIDLALAVTWHAIACAITVAAVRALQWAISRRHSPTVKH